MKKLAQLTATLCLPGSGWAVAADGLVMRKSTYPAK
jgi:hypothetical protein